MHKSLLNIVSIVNRRQRDEMMVAASPARFTKLSQQLAVALGTQRIYRSRRASGSAAVSALMMPRSATTCTRAMAKRPRNRSSTGISVVTPTVLPGHLSGHTGRLSPSRIICRRLGR
jgi:hypothetical protein